MRAILQRAMDVSGWGVAILATVLAVHLTQTAVTLFRQSEPSSTNKGKPRTVTPSKPSRAHPRAAQAGSASKSDSIISVILTVRHGTERNEVYVNGELLGQTPFASDVVCRLDESLNVQIVATKGPMIERTVPCRGEVIDVAVE